MAVDPAGDLYVVGSTEGSLTGEAPAGRFDAYLRVYNPVGDELWTRQFGSPADDYGVGVAVDAAGNPTVVGSTDGSLPGETSTGGTEAFLRRFDAAGVTRWTNQFGTGAADEGWAVAVDPAGDTYVAGTTVPKPLLGTAPEKTHCFARKYDPTGTAVWAHPYGTDTPTSHSVSPSTSTATPTSPVAPTEPSAASDPPENGTPTSWS